MDASRRRAFLSAGTFLYVPTVASIRGNKRRGIRENEGEEEGEREKMKSYCAVKLYTTVAARTVNGIAFKSL